MKISIYFVIFLLFSCTVFSQKDTLSIIRHTDKDIVLPKDLKVVYRGITNYLSIEVPNCKSFTAIGKGLNLVAKNIYTLSPGSGLESVINIEIVLKNNKIVSEKHIFKIRNIKSPIAYINHLNGDIVKISKINLKNAIITVDLGDKNLDFGFEVVGFKMKILGKENINIDGNTINTKAFEIINKNCSRYNQITIFDIIPKSFIDVCCVKINPIIIEIL